MPKNKEVEEDVQEGVIQEVVAQSKTKQEDKLEPVQANEVKLPPVTNRQYFSSQTYKAAGNVCYLTMYGKDGASISLAQSKARTLSNITSKKPANVNGNITYFLSSNTMNKSYGYTANTNQSKISTETIKYARVNYGKGLFLIFQKGYEMEIGKIEWTLVQDFGILISFEDFESIYSLIDDKGSRIQVVNNESPIEDDI